MSKTAESGMDRQQGQAEAERLLCALVTAIDSNRDEIRGHGHRTPGRWDADGTECQACRAWRQAREYVRAIAAGRGTAQPPAIVPGCTRCRGCQSYRYATGAWTGTACEYCNQDGLPLRPDEEPCSEYKPEMHQDAPQRD
jgi:hypothetical protein